jgi:hypothetical protein
MAYVGFNKLKNMMAKSGAQNPAGAAAAVMRKKYKKSDIVKHQQAGTSMEHSKPKKTYGE